LAPYQRRPRIFGTLYLPNDKRPARYGADCPLSPDMLGQVLQPFGLTGPGSMPVPAEAVVNHDPAQARAESVRAKCRRAACH
jgi:hypothetical protein